MNKKGQLGRWGKNKMSVGSCHAKTLEIGAKSTLVFWDHYCSILFLIVSRKLDKLGLCSSLTPSGVCL